MTGRFDAAYYEDLRGRVRGVLIAVAEAFPAEQVGLVDELIDANESGVALEMLVGMLRETEASVPSAVVDQIAGLVNDMDMPPQIAAQVKELKTA